MVVEIAAAAEARAATIVTKSALHDFGKLGPRHPLADLPLPLDPGERSAADDHGAHFLPLGPGFLLVDFELERRSGLR